MPTLLFRSSMRHDSWVAGLHAAMPELEVRTWPDRGDPKDIDYTLVWLPPQELFEGLVNLKAVFSIGAGVDHLLGDLTLPEGVPVVRMTDDTLTEGMTDYVLYNVLRFHRGFDIYESRANNREWRQHEQTENARRRIGIMGLGVLGKDSANALVQRGFDVAGWSRTRKNLEGVTSFAGLEELDDFLARTEILVVLLPLTPDTVDIIDAGLLAKLPRGACVINAARGGHLDVTALTSALDSGHLRAAALDVFKEEPLPDSDPLWQRDDIFITPHAASLTLPATAAARVVDNIRLIEAGKQPENIADLSRGY